MTPAPLPSQSRTTSHPGWSTSASTLLPTTPLTMSTTSVTTTNIPKLTHDPSTYAGWRTAIEVALQLADSWNAALGLDAEPNRARWINRAPGATGTVLARNARAGSAMPEASETTSGNAMTADERKEWEKWQTRESKAQGMLKASVSSAIKLDLDDLKSSGDMWTHCEHLHALNIVENQREVRRKLYSLDLQDDATSEEMAAHVELFSKLVMEAKLVGIGHTSHERAAMFVGTILGPAFRPVIVRSMPWKKPRATGRFYSQSTTPSRLAARLALLLDRPHLGVVPSWQLWASRGSAERLRSKGERIVDKTCRRSNVTSVTR
jgi:hypothetical protein